MTVVWIFSNNVLRVHLGNCSPYGSPQTMTKIDDRQLDIDRFISTAYIHDVPTNDLPIFEVIILSTTIHV